jgi:uncharacterized protein (DUF924 family)
VDSNDRLSFWFEEIRPAKWSGKDFQFDQIITQRFADVHYAANCCELYRWRKTTHGRLAEIIVLDQFIRNIFCDNILSFAAVP